MSGVRFQFQTIIGPPEINERGYNQNAGNIKQKPHRNDCGLRNADCGFHSQPKLC